MSKGKKILYLKEIFGHRKVNQFCQVFVAFYISVRTECRIFIKNSYSKKFTQINSKAIK